jgi:nitrite reductase/ring-hydroxylating ferredoxin subunit
VEGLEALPSGAHAALAVSGTEVLFLRAAGALLAYRNACAGCGGRLDSGRLEEGAIFTCGACGRRYDVGRAGRALAADGPSLSPLPLLVDRAGAKIALAGVAP